MRDGRGILMHPFGSRCRRIRRAPNQAGRGAIFIFIFFIQRGSPYSPCHCQATADSQLSSTYTRWVLWSFRSFRF